MFALVWNEAVVNAVSHNGFVNGAKGRESEAKAKLGLQEPPVTKSLTRQAELKRHREERATKSD